MPPPPHPDAAVIAWSRVAHYGGALFEALDAPEDAGGAGLAATREALDVELGRLRARQRHFPRRRRIG